MSVYVPVALQRQIRKQFQDPDWADTDGSCHDLGTGNESLAVSASMSPLGLNLRFAS
jgi:hypothetical protein